jgi:hypothetical protein
MDLNYIDRIALVIRQRLPDELVADDSGADDLFRLYGLLALAKGIHTTAEDVHMLGLSGWSSAAKIISH